MALSAIIRQAMPTRPRERDAKAAGTDGKLATVVFKSRPRLFVLPVGVAGVFEVPERAATPHHGQLGEIVLRGRRSRRPFECPRIPRVIPARLPFPQAT